MKPSPTSTALLAKRGCCYKTSSTLCWKETLKFWCYAQLWGGEEGSFPEGFGPGGVANFKFCPTANVDVERIFSIYKTLLTDRRHCLTEDNVVKIMETHCFYSPAADC